MTDPIEEGGRVLTSKSSLLQRMFCLFFAFFYFVFVWPKVQKPSKTTKKNKTKRTEKKKKKNKMTHPMDRSTATFVLPCVMAAAKPKRYPLQSNHCVRIASGHKVYKTSSYFRSDDMAVGDLEHLAKMVAQRLVAFSHFIPSEVDRYVH